MVSSITCLMRVYFCNHGIVTGVFTLYLLLITQLNVGQNNTYILYYCTSLVFLFRSLSLLLITLQTFGT